MKKKTLRTTVSLVLLLTAAGAAWWWYSSSQRRSTVPGPAVAKVTKHDFSSSVLATGAVRPQVGAEVRVGARISGRVERLYANIGDTVNKGQTVAELQQADLEAAVERLEAEVKVAAAKVEDADARAKLAKQEYRRQANLIKEDFTSQDAVDRAMKETRSSQAGLALARRQLDAARAAVREAQVKLSYATIRAPISGVIASVATQEGETVTAGLRAPTFVTIIDLRRLQVDAYVDEVDIGRVRVGQRALFSVDTFPDREFNGRVTAIYPNAVIQENVVNYDVVISITDHYRGLLRPEMTASVTILLKKKSGVLAVPVKAIQRERGTTLVLVRGDDGSVKQRGIKVGWRDKQWIEVVSGLREGETVLLEQPSGGKDQS